MTTRTRCCLCLGMLIVAPAVVAQEDAAPGLEFLEYLGSWQDSDEEWLMLADEMPEDGESERETPAGESDEATDAGDEESEQDHAE